MLRLPLPNGMAISIKEETLLDCLKFKKLVNAGADASGDLAEICSYIEDVDDKFLDYEPWELPGLTKLGRGNGVWYFFYHRVRKYPKGRCWKRTTTTGSYNETGDPSIENAKKRILVYYEGRGSKAAKTNWVLYEYESGNTDSGSGDYVVGCLVENPILKRKRNKMSDCDSELDNLASASKASASVAEDGSVLSCMKKKSPKRKKTPEAQFNSNPGSAPDNLVAVPEVHLMEKENQGFPTEVACPPSKPQTEEGRTPIVDSVNSHWPLRHSEPQSQITSMEYATTKLQMEGPPPMNFSSSRGSIVYCNELQTSRNTWDISDQETQKENGLSLEDFSSPICSPINHYELQPCQNMVGDETHEVQSQEILNQESHTQQFHDLWSWDDHGIPHNVDISRSYMSPYDQNLCSNSMKKLTPETHSSGEAYLGSTLQSTHQHLPVFAGAENGGHTQLSEPSTVYRNESLLVDDLMSPSWGISYDEILGMLGDDCSTGAIGGTPSNSN